MLCVRDLDTEATCVGSTQCMDGFTCLCVISVVPVHRVGPEAARVDPIRRPLRRNLFRRQQAEVVDGHRSHRKSVAHLPGTFPFSV
jgi:hypothetical protein